MKRRHSLMAMMIALGGCAFTDVRELSQDSFLISTTAAPVCGISGAQDVAFKIAAIEVIKRGGDRYVIEGAQTGSEFGGFVGGTPIQRSNQGVVVRMLKQGDADFNRGLSARKVLGSDWQEQVASGGPNTC